MCLTFNPVHLPVELHWLYCYNVNAMCVFTYSIVLWTCKKDRLDPLYVFGLPMKLNLKMFPFWKQKGKRKKKEDKPESRRRLSSGPPRVRAQVQLRREKEDAAEYAAISPRLCLAEATELADDSAAHGQKRLTGLPCVSPSAPPSPSSPPGGVGGEIHEVSGSTSPAEARRSQSWI